jgi:hypothetical protein
MSSKLSKTNPHLRDPVARERAIVKSVASSSAIEGIRAPFTASARGNSIPKTQKRKN